MDKKTKNPTAKRRFKNDEAGQGLAEYALILSLAALVVFVIINLVGPAIGDVFSRLVQRAPVAPPSLTSYTPAPTYTPTQTVDPYSTPTNTATATPPGNTATPTTTSTVTNTPTATPTSTPTCTGFGPYAAPGRVEMENFMCGGPDIAFVDSGGDGGPGSGVFRADVTIQGPDLRAATDSGGGYQLDWLVANEWVQYKINAAETRFYNLSVRYAAGNANGRFHLEIWRNGSRIYASSSLAVPNSGGDTIWNNLTVSEVPFLAGANEIRLVIENGGFALNYFDVSLPVPTATPTVTSTPFVCYSLTTAVNPANSGTITASPAPNCAGGTYTQGTAVTLSAAPNTDYQFTSWSGGATGTSSSVVVTMNSDKSVTANFSQCFAVTTAVVPTGSGTVTTSPGPNCGTKYTQGTTVTFTANPAANRTFTNWSGSASGTTNPTTLAINAAADVIANFITPPVELINANFNTGEDNFNYLDDTFRTTNNPNSANGVRGSTIGNAGSGGLKVTLGENSTSAIPASGGWRRSFTLAAAGAVSVQFDYRLLNTGLDSGQGECSDVLVTIDNTLYGSGGNDYVLRQCGGLNGSWQTFTFQSSQLTSGSHTITIGGYLTKSNKTDEKADVFIDNVLVQTN